MLESNETNQKRIEVLIKEKNDLTLMSEALKKVKT